MQAHEVDITFALYEYDVNRNNWIRFLKALFDLV